jgi:hypothetical protein
MLTQNEKLFLSHYERTTAALFQWYFDTRAGRCGWGEGLSLTKRDEALAILRNKLDELNKKAGKT